MLVSIGRSLQAALTIQQRSTSRGHQWKRMHAGGTRCIAKGVRLEDVDPSGRVLVSSRPCHDDQRCICRGDGKLLRAAVEQLKA